jgi:hypothetical protein
VGVAAIGNQKRTSIEAELSQVRAGEHCVPGSLDGKTVGRAPGHDVAPSPSAAMARRELCEIGRAPVTLREAFQLTVASPISNHGPL